MSEKELGAVRNKEIGFIFQNYQLIPTYDILQNIIMPLIVRGMTTEDAQKACMPVIEMLGNVLEQFDSVTTVYKSKKATRMQGIHIFRSPDASV